MDIEYKTVEEKRQEFAQKILFLSGENQNKTELKQ